MNKTSSSSCPRPAQVSSLRSIWATDKTVCRHRLTSRSQNAPFRIRSPGTARSTTICMCRAMQSAGQRAITAQRVIISRECGATWLPLPPATRIWLWMRLRRRRLGPAALAFAESTMRPPSPTGTTIPSLHRACSQTRMSAVIPVRQKTARFAGSPVRRPISSIPCKVSALSTVRTPTGTTESPTPFVSGYRATRAVCRYTTVPNGTT